MPPFLYKKELNHRKVYLLSNRHCGKAGGNCELLAISFIPLCNCQCHHKPDRMDWGRDSTAVYLEVSYGVHTSGHGRALHARHDHCECELKIAAEFRAGPFQSAATLTVIIL